MSKLSALRNTFPVGTLVTADGYPGVWRVNQPIGSQSDAHLAPFSSAAKECMQVNGTCSLITFATQIKERT